MGSSPNPGYFAIALDNASRDGLIARFVTLPAVYADHCTVLFGSDNPLDLPPAFRAEDIGTTFCLRVIGYACRADSGIEAVVVELVDRVRTDRFSGNQIAHVTLATDGATAPFQSNSLLAGGYQRLADGPLLFGRLVHVPGNGSFRSLHTEAR